MLVYQYENYSGYITGNICNLFYDVIIMPLLTSNLLLKFEYCQNQKSSLGGKKIIFYNFLRALFWSNIKH